MESIIANISGERTKKIVGELVNFHRIQASKEFLQTLNVIKTKLEKNSNAEFEIQEYIADGKKNYYDWSTPISWDIKDGELIQIEPVKRNLCRFSEVPESICTHSKPVNLTAEVVHIGDASNAELKDKETKGKIVLTTARPRAIFEKTDELGALGIIAYPSEERAKGYLEMIQYVGLWPNAENVSKSTFGFSISRKQAIDLIKSLNKGEKVVVRANIDADLYEGKMHILTTKIEGSRFPEEEIILIAHLCHPAPSANDNASGSSLLLEIFRTIQKLIHEGIIEQPHRTLRFLWVPEFHGTIPWIKEKADSKKTKPILCINLDMVGEHPGIIGYPFTFSKSSISTPSFLNDLISRNIEIIKDKTNLIEQSGWQFPWNYRIQPFSGGSDHILFNDEPFRIPSVMFGHSDTFHHTNLDTIEKVDPTTLKRVGVLTTLSVLMCAYEDGYTDEIIKSYFEGYLQRKAKISNLILDSISSDKYTKSLIQKILISFENFEKEVLEQIKHATKILDLKRMGVIEKDISHFSSSMKVLIDENAFWKIETENARLSLIPFRKWVGPANMNVLFRILDDEKQISEELNLSEEQVQRIVNFMRSKSQNYDGRLLELINLVDNRRDIEQIAATLVLYDWEITDPDIISTVLIYAEKLGFIEMKYQI